MTTMGVRQQYPQRKQIICKSQSSSCARSIRAHPYALKLRGAISHPVAHQRKAGVASPPTVLFFQPERLMPADGARYHAMLVAYEPPLFLASWLELTFAVAEQATRLLVAYFCRRKALLRGLSPAPSTQETARNFITASASTHGPPVFSPVIFQSNLSSPVASALAFPLYPITNLHGCSPCPILQRPSLSTSFPMSSLSGRTSGATSSRYAVAMGVRVGRIAGEPRVPS